MPKFNRYEEDVNGVVIGLIETREYYRFYSKKDNRIIWDAGHFKNDKEAVTAFQNKFQSEPIFNDLLDEGIEMRVWE